MAHPIFEHNARFVKLSFDRKLLCNWADELFEWLFCIHPAYADKNTFIYKEIELKQKLTEFIDQTNRCNVSAEVFIEPFFNQLPRIHAMLRDDLEAFTDLIPRRLQWMKFCMPIPDFLQFRCIGWLMNCSE